MIANYTQDELKTIAQAPMMTGMAIAMVDMGIVSTAIEATAMSKEFAGAAKKYPNNSIIQSVFSDEAIKQGVIKPEKPHVKPEEVKSGVLVDNAIATIHTALSTIEGKASADEIREYKEFIYACAEAVANAAGQGLFGSGTKVSAAEAAALAKVKAALEL